MAEKKDTDQVVPGTGAAPINRPSDVERVLGSANELIAEAPEPTVKGGKIYKVMYPTDQFVMAGQPVVNTTGVRLTSEQAKEILPVAEASGVRIVEVEGDN